MKIGLNLSIVGLKNKILNFLLRDDFITTQSAPLTSPRTAEPGPGTLTITDIGNKISISGGSAVFAEGSGVGAPSLRGSSIVRSGGLAAIYAVTNATIGSQFKVGFDGDGTGEGLPNVWFRTSGEIRIQDIGLTVDGIGTYALATLYRIAVVCRPTIGALYLIKGGAFTNWTLLYTTSGLNSANVEAWVGWATATTATQVSLDSARVIQLAAPFDSDYGLATQRLAGAITVGTTFVHEGNSLFYYTIATRTSSGDMDFRFRKQDASNHWKVTVNPSGDIALVETVAGTPTTRGSSLGWVGASNQTMAIVVDGTTIRVYHNNVLRITYSSASNFATATAGELNTLGTGGAVSDIISWPRTLSGAAASLLDSAVI